MEEAHALTGSLKVGAGETAHYQSHDASLAVSPHEGVPEEVKGTSGMHRQWRGPGVCYTKQCCPCRNWQAGQKPLCCTSIYCCRCCSRSGWPP